ncbi:unnamed protein product, partial [Sphagnum jensenii]
EIEGFFLSSLSFFFPRSCATRQEELITELEEELETAQTQLKDKEEELEMWKDCVRRLTEVSLLPAFS